MLAWGLRNQAKQVRKKQEDLLNSYYADIAKHSGKINAMHIDRVFRSVPMQMQQVQDHSTARFKFRGVVPGVTHYDRLAGAIDWLEAAGLAKFMGVKLMSEETYRKLQESGKFDLHSWSMLETPPDILKSNEALMGDRIEGEVSVHRGVARGRGPEQGRDPRQGWRGVVVVPRE